MSVLMSASTISLRLCAGRSSKIDGISSEKTEVEQTGASSQFYDKFNVRYNISQVVKTIWLNPINREQLHAESLSHHDHFTRFVNMLMMDVTTRA